MKRKANFALAEFGLKPNITGVNSNLATTKVCERAY